MTDLNVILETILLLASPFIPIAIGIMLRRRFAPAPEQEGSGPRPGTGWEKAGRVAGTILVWTGILSIIFFIVVVLNFKGII